MLSQDISQGRNTNRSRLTSVEDRQDRSFEELLMLMRSHYKIKLVIDYRDINLMTKLRHHPLPDLSGVLHDLYDGLELEPIRFSTEDGTSFYQCLGIEENFQKYFDFADSRAIY